MERSLYLVKSKGVYQVRIEGNHYCLSAVGSYDHAVECAVRIIKKYRSMSLLIQKMRGMDDGGRIPVSEHERCLKLADTKETRDLTKRFRADVHEKVNRKAPKIKISSAVKEVSKQTAHTTANKVGKIINRIRPIQQMVYN